MAEAWQSAWVEVLPDFKNFKRTADRQMSDVLGNAGTRGGALAGKNVGGGILGGIKGIAGPLVGVVAALGIGKLVGDAIGAGIRYGMEGIDLASDLEQSTGAVLAVFKDQAETIEGFGRSAAKDVGLARTEYQTFAVVVGAQLKNLGIPVKRISGQTNDLIRLGADLAAQFGGPTSEAVAALSSLLRGERDPIERYGVGIKQADINARLAAQGLKDLEGDARKQAEIQATLAILFEQTADAQGTFAREGDTLAGQQQRLQAALQDTQTRLGEALLPAFSKVVGYASSELLPKFEQIIDRVGPKLSDALEKAGPKFAELAEKAGPLLEDFLLATSDAIPKVIDNLAELTAAWSDTITFLNDLDQKNKPFLDFMKDTFSFQAMGDFFFGQGREDRIKWAEETFGIGSPMADKIKQGMEETGSAAGDNLSFGIQGKSKDVEAGFLGVTSPMAQKVRAQLDADMRAAGEEAAAGLAAGIDAKKAVAALRAREMARGVRDVLRQELKIQSPSKVMQELGALTGEGFALGIEGSRSKVDSAMRSLVSVPDVPALRSGVAIPPRASMSSIAAAVPAGQTGEPRQVNQTINAVQGQSAFEIAQIARNDLNEMLRSA